MQLPSIRTSRLLALRRLAWAFALVTATGCKGGLGGDAATKTQQLEARIAEVEKLSAEKDELIQDFVANTEFLNTINTELDRVRRLPAGARVVVVKPGESPIAVAAYRDSILVRIRAMTARLDSTQSRLSAMSGAAANQNGSLTKQLESYRSALEQVRDQLEGQTEELASLQNENSSLRTERDRLRADRADIDKKTAELNEQLTDAQEEASTVYFVAGSKDALIKAGIVQEQGGARNVLLMKRGKTLTPRADLSIDAFTALSKTGNVEIRLPKDKQAYRIVSSHDVKYLSPVEKNGTIRGTVRVSSPEAFWAASRFLIFVEQ